MKMLPSSAYSSFLSRLQISVVISRFSESTNCVPMFCSRKQPVPYVFLASPGRDAKLPKQRGLLISGNACDLGRLETQRRGHLADLLARPDDLRHHALGDAE